MNRRWLAGVGVGVLLGAAAPGVAGADPAEPTDYQTVVIGVTPPTAAIKVRIVGGDSFVELTVERGTKVVVLGYKNEPYLRFRTDGIVEQNGRSPTLYQNADRNGDGEIPPGASARVPPAWEAVGSGGRYAWHDHRAHWMAPDHPEQAVPGDRILEAKIPLRVNDERVDVAVASSWLPRPSKVPLVMGAGAAVAMVGAALITRRRLAWALLLAAAAAGGIGWWQFQSLPPETGPRAVWWILPVIAAVSAGIGLSLGRRPVSYGLVALGAVELAIWVLIRRTAVVRAIIPTDAPFWLDRGVMAAAAVAATAAAVGALISLLSPFSA